MVGDRAPCDGRVDGMFPSLVLTHSNAAVTHGSSGTGDLLGGSHQRVGVWCARMVGQLKQWRLTQTPTLRGGISTAARMARRETPPNRYTVAPLVKVTRTLPVMGLAVRRVMALLCSVSMGSCMVSWLVDLLIVDGEGGWGCPPCATLQIGHHGADLQSVDGRIIPAAPVGGLFRTTLPEQRHQLLVVATAAGSIVEPLIVANPQGDIPGLPVCPSVESVAHGLSRLVDVISLQGQGSPATIPCGSLPTVTLHTAAVDLLIIEAVIEIEIEDFAWHVLNLGEQGVGFHGSSRLVCCNSTGSVGGDGVDLCHLLSCHSVKGLGGL